VAASYVNPNETSEKATTHPDLRFETIRPDPKTKKPRKLISIEQVRELQSFLAGRALVGGKKVAVVDEAQALSIDAQNAFLKTLEEPLGNALIILVAHNASALAATVRSRCQRMAFAPLDNGEIERILVERHGQSAEKARLAATFAGGSVGTALSPDIASLRSLTEDVSAFVARARAATQGEISDFARVFVPYEKITGPERVAGILRRLEIPLSILRGRLRDAASASDPGSPRAASLAAALRATEAAYEAWIGLRQNANPLLAVENMWLEIAESLARS
jgi:DNA polymerase-3 subunit delta'